LALVRDFYGLRLAGGARQALARLSGETDHFHDLEFVHVRAGLDDPHRREWMTLDDHPHTTADNKSLTAFNHYIDIRKGPGRFDDYDGYSYWHGSARKDQYQNAEELVGGWAHLAGVLAGYKVDEGLSFWFNDEYVHAPGHPWYRHCSPALERYSFPQDKKRFGSIAEEMAKRFPLAESRGKKGRGFPYSVFTPVDNLARHWYERYLKKGKWKHLGPVMHAVQDASIPHHTAGCNGNWHVQYEKALDRIAAQASRSQVFLERSRRLLARWERPDHRPPQARLGKASRLRRPAPNWDIRQLVTWMALHAYQEYEQTYKHFRKGYQINPESMELLLSQALALSALVLLKAKSERPRR
jgi:hypothetical protein